jgi:hypothetical protein
MFFFSPLLHNILSWKWVTLIYQYSCSILWLQKKKIGLRKSASLSCGPIYRPLLYAYIIN